MSKHLKSQLARAQLTWLLPILALSPLALGAKGCNAGVVGDDCPTTSDCPSGSAGKGSAGSGSGQTQVCGGLLGTGCADDKYCDFPSKAQCGAADQTGTCVSKPEACDLIYAPVCGCDDRTYASDCSAHDAGISVAYDGECQPSGGGGSGAGGSSSSGGSGTGGSGTGEFCGGIAAIQCAADQYCDYPLTAQCGAGDQGGTCKSSPPACDANLQPVCGCDGKTYSNACMASLAGVSVSAEGECKPAKACGEIGGCEKDEFCDFPPESSCGVADGPGVCAKIPVDMICITVYAPVCGCDGKTYGNSCNARSAGVSVAADGECACGGLAGGGCQDGFFCDFPPAAACGAGDQTGTCMPEPELCPQVVALVCGCDGQTYSNACVASSLGTDISHTGACN